MLKKRIASLDDVEEKYRGLYTEQTDGTFLLDVSIEGMGDIEGLKQNNYDLKGEKIKLQERLDEVTSKLQEYNDQNLWDDKKFEELLESKNKAWEAKYKALEERANKLTEGMKNSTLQATVQSLANELAGERALLIEPHLKSRVDVVEKDGAFEVVIKGADGAVVTSEQLIAEFKNNAVYAPILKGRDSSGSGGGKDGVSTGEAADAASYEKYYNPKGKDYNASKQSELATKNKALHDSLVAKYDLNNPASFVG